MKHKIRHTPETMDSLIHKVHEHRQNLINGGHIDAFGKRKSPGPARKESATHEGYCLKCRAKKKVQTKAVNPTDRGAHHAHGTCPDCGSSVHTFMKADEGKKLRDALQSNLAYTGGV